jgi:DNA (cytosine-5)-methyltransferase 1
MLRHVDLCSGIGGFALGFQWAELSKPVLFCDIEPWSRKVLRKHWPDVPIAEDVKELANDPNGLIPECDIITAGYPCQPFSVAGDRRGQEDDRHIWPEIFTIINAKRPTWAVFENVYGHVSMGLDEVLSDLEGSSYAVRPFIVPACAVDAPHRRDRVWIIARNVGNTQHNGQFAKPKLCSDDAPSNEWGEKEQEKTFELEGANRSSDGASISRSKSKSQQSTFYKGDRADNVGDTISSRQHGINRRQSEQKPQNGCEDVADTDNPRQSASQGNGKDGRNKERNNIRRSGKDVADTDYPRQQKQRRSKPTRKEHKAPECGSWWKPEPSVGRVAHGIPRRVDRLRGLGNAIVPQIAQRIGETIKQCS